MMPVLVLLSVAAFPAGAARATEPPAEPKPDPMARICNAFGPGYQLIPGTTTCIKIGGYVRGGLSFSNKGGTGDFVPPPNPPPNGKRPR